MTYIVSNLRCPASVDLILACLTQLVAGSQALHPELKDNPQESGTCRKPTLINDVLCHSFPSQHRIWLKLRFCRILMEPPKKDRIAALNSKLLLDLIF